jgi:ferritin-like metal-binding protein YciE
MAERKHTKREQTTRRRSEGGSLKEREYRDKEGKIHHHTRTYMEQHKGEERGGGGSSDRGEGDQPRRGEEEATRAEMGEALDVTEGRLSPGRLRDRALEYVRTELGRSQLGELIERNPLPVMLIGLGLGLGFGICLAWLALSERSRRADEARGYYLPAEDRYGRPSRLAHTDAVAAGSREHLVAWLRDAHAMEHQAIEVLEKQASRLEHYPELRAKIEEHLRQTHRQAELVEGCLHRLGTDTSGLKSAAGKLMGSAQQLSGLFASDEVVKSAIADHAFERYEIASYRALITTAEEAGEPEIARTCEQILHQEEVMAAWLADHLPEVARLYVQREAAGEAAKT